MDTRTFQNGTRTDVHAPSNFDPSDYQIIGYADLRQVEVQAPYSPEEFLYAEAAEAQRKEIVFRLFATYYPSSDCAHCGHPNLRWVAAARHAPTGQVIPVGEECATNRLSLAGRDEFSSKFIRTHAANVAAHLEKLAKVAGAQEVFKAAEPEVFEFLVSYTGTFPFLLDLREDLMVKWGSLTERQVAGVKKCMERAAEQQTPRVEPTTRLMEGRRTIEGVIVSIKEVEGWNDGSWTKKMLVVEADGNKVFGTVPAAIYSQAEKGVRVRFVAKVEAKEAHFGFYSRPSKAVVVGVAA